MVIISDSSPLILLARIGLLSLVKELFQEIIIPQEVYQEVVIQGESRPGSREAKEASWIKVERVLNLELIEAFHHHGLSRKDAAVIALAQEKQADAVLMDEQRGRAICRETGLEVIGTGGLLVRAKEKGLIPNIRSPLDGLIRQGFRLTPELYETFLEEAGEDATAAS
jgi:predicted nucleic acid-binding protein